VGPDNGVLEPVTRGASEVKVRDIDFPPDGASPVFHGRDIFSPGAARLAREDELDSFSREGLPLLALPSYGHDRIGDHLVTRVVHVDVFGNIQTPVPASAVPDIVDSKRELTIWIADQSYPAHVVRTYSDLAGDEIGLLVSSSGHIELAQNGAPAAVLLEARIGDDIALDLE
jgi:S-adenosylmethionine hydrolase